MEFEQNTPVSDEERHMAEAKKVVLQPLHSSVTPDELPDAVVAAVHTSGEVIGNIASDIEQDASRVEPSQSVLQSAPAATTAKKNPLSLTILTAVGLVLFILVIIFIIFQQ